MFACIVKPSDVINVHDSTTITVQLCESLLDEAKAEGILVTTYNSQELIIRYGSVSIQVESVKDDSDLVFRHFNLEALMNVKFIVSSEIWGLKPA